jgi:hypothetical protein
VRGKKAKDRSHTTGDKICMITEQVHLQHSSPVRESQGDTGSGQIDDAKQKQESRQSACTHAPCRLPNTGGVQAGCAMLHASGCWPPPLHCRVGSSWWLGGCTCQALRKGAGPPASALGVCAKLLRGRHTCGRSSDVPALFSLAVTQHMGRRGSE